MTFHVPEKYRIKEKKFYSDETYGNNGAFKFINKLNTIFFIIASDGLGWEHVSISLSNRTPTWEEMCEIKNIFWDEEDCVIQFHPSKKDYINNHKFCLHLWRPINEKFPIPDKIFVGI